MDITKTCPKKVLSAAEAVREIKRGSRVFLGTGCGEPQHLIHAMAADEGLQDILVYQMLSYALARYMEDPKFLRRFSLKLFFISSVMRRAAFDGKIDYLPSYLSRIPKLFKSGQIGLDVALIQASPPDRFGYCSLGVSVDITRPAIESAGLVIAQINRQMPRTWGNSFVHIDRVDRFVVHDEPLVVMDSQRKPKEVERRIGFYLSQLVEDGATLQVGFGRLPDALLTYLANKKDLGIHTQVITDGFLPLFKSGAVTNERKALLPGRTVASLCMGSKRIYNFLNNNPMFYFRSSEFVNDPNVIARNNNLVSISSALEVDLTGQVCTDSLGHLFYSGIGDQVDFIRGSAMSPGGFSIIVMPSTAEKGQKSRIVPQLSQGAGVASTRGDVNFIVTEYGIAELQGKSIYQRVMELAQIAHPKFREELIQKAKERHYIFADQLPPSEEDLIFVEGYKSDLMLKDGRVLEFRPLFPSDEIAYRNFFYSLEAKSIYYRYFYNMSLFSHEVLQEQWASIDYRKNISLIGLIQSGGRKEVMALGTYAQEDQTTAEVAFLVREDFHSQGVATHMLIELQRIAVENGYTRFSASVLADNAGMLHVFKKRFPHAKFMHSGGEIRVEMPFVAPAKVSADE